ncbi:MAG: transcriptional regulator [Rhizobiales bacterium]|nr:transcriptional regulator [Hyphomicrobiales bacterium]
MTGQAFELQHSVRPGFARYTGTAIRRLAIAATLCGTLVLAGCFGEEFEKASAPVPKALIKEMTKLGVEERAPIFIRIFKKEAELEVWKQAPNGEYKLLKTFEICAWSGALGPKLKEGDRQAPEGFYTVGPSQMNPNSSFHLSFNIGFPNSFDKAHDRTGSFLMVHGACSSAGCYSMEDSQIEEIYALAREAFWGGQKRFQVHAFPFRMTPANMALFQTDENMPFWRTLKQGYEHFELTKVAPTVDACDGAYLFNARPTDGGTFDARKQCPAYEVPENLKTAVDAKIAEDRALEEKIAAAYTTPTERRHAELMSRLDIELGRMKKFEDRSLAYSSIEKRRLLDIQDQLVALGYNADGSIPVPAATAAAPVSVATKAATDPSVLVPSLAPPGPVPSVAGPAGQDATPALPVQSLPAQALPAPANAIPGSGFAPKPQPRPGSFSGQSAAIPAEKKI